MKINFLHASKLFERLKSSVSYGDSERSHPLDTLNAISFNIQHNLISIDSIAFLQVTCLGEMA